MANTEKTARIWWDRESVGREPSSLSGHHPFRATTKNALQKDILKSTTDKSKWNSKNVQVTYRKEGKKKKNRKKKTQYKLKQKIKWQTQALNINSYIKPKRSKYYQLTDRDGQS